MADAERGTLELGDPRIPLISSNRHAILRADVCAPVRYRETRRLKYALLCAQSVGYDREYDDRYCSSGRAGLHSRERWDIRRGSYRLLEED